MPDVPGHAQIPTTQVDPALRFQLRGVTALSGTATLASFGRWSPRLSSFEDVPRLPPRRGLATWLFRPSGGIRTRYPIVNSDLLYQLSYAWVLRPWWTVTESNRRLPITRLLDLELTALSPPVVFDSAPGQSVIARPGGRRFQPTHYR